MNITPPAVIKLLIAPPLSKPFKLLSPAILVQQPAEFASALAHEVRNPLTNINLAVEMLHAGNLDHEQKLYLDMIIRASERINALVSDLLTSFRTTERQPETHCIHEMLEEVLSSTLDRLSLKNISVLKEYTTLDCRVSVNKQKIKIALTNIIINAIDAMPSQEGQLKLVTKCMNDKCIIEIGDNGAGISKNNLEKIFNPYFTNKPGGMGLGLSTTLETLKSDHATVVVKSEEGRGTRFILSFDRMQPLTTSAFTIPVTPIPLFSPSPPGSPLSSYPLDAPQLS